MYFVTWFTRSQFDTDAAVSEPFFFISTVQHNRSPLVSQYPVIQTQKPVQHLQMQ